MLESFDQALIYEIVEELHLFRSILQNEVDDVLDHGLGKEHVVLEICKCDLRLDHPELRRVTCRVTVLGTECRSESVDVLKCHCEGLAVQLAADREVGRLVEEVLAVVDLTVVRLRDVVEIKCCDLKHLTCTLAVGTGDQRCMYINEVSLLEESVDRISAQGSYSEDRLEQVRSRTQMCDRS